ncbi:MAG: hypothetical protein B7Y81_19015 [Caulobacter sp. 32-67-35]|nr:MAG: hypothetical protein B7Y81_19015 [Caulobacter sp. 32-67-35]
MDPGPDNPLGYWEPWEMVALDDEILEAVDSRWDNVFAVKDNERAWAARSRFLSKAQDFLTHNFGDQDLLVMKDPRSSILASFWRQALEEIAVDPVYVIMVRHPLEVAESLLARNGSPREKSLLLWTSYMLAIERDTRDAPRVFVTYSDMLNDWRGVLDRVEAVMGRPLPRRTPSAGVDIERFLSKSHRHHEADVAALEEIPGVWAGAQTTYSWMMEAARGLAPQPGSLAAVETELDALERTVGPVLAEMRQELAQIPVAKAEAAEAREDLARMRFSLQDARQETADLRSHFDRFHAEADARDQAAIAREQAAVAREQAAITHYQGVAEQWKREALAEQVKVEILRDRVAKAEREAGMAQALSENLQAQNAAILSSTSWRVTWPLRAIVRRLRPG